MTEAERSLVQSVIEFLHVRCIWGGIRRQLIPELRIPSPRRGGLHKAQDS
jgi:hypothetical protein